MTDAERIAWLEQRVADLEAQRESASEQARFRELLLQRTREERDRAEERLRCMSTT